MRRLGFRCLKTGKPFGFTLAELLIALLILGVVATFTIPKVLQSQANSQKKAVFRETLAVVAQLTEARAKNGGQFANATEMQNYFKDNLNYVKRCPANPQAEGCWSAFLTNPDAYLLHSGAAISSINFGGGGTGDRETIHIDWNGPLPPNVLGDDIMFVTACFGPNVCDTGSAIAGSRPKGPGAIGPSSAPFESLYTWVFSD